MIWTAGFKSPEGKPRIHHEDPADPNSLAADVNRISGVRQGAVKGKVEVDLKAESNFLQIRISLSLFIAA